MKKHIALIASIAALNSLTTFKTQAQISGTVTINSGSAASASNFQNWESFWKNLQGLSRTDAGPSTGAGISASVTVDVKSSLTESKMVEFPVISGLGSTKTITIKGNGNSLSFAGPHEVISFSGGDYITIDNLVVRNTGANGARNTCIRFYNNSDYNTISNCKLEFSNLSIGAANGSAYVAFAPNDTVFNNASSVLTGSYNTITNNLCRTTLANSPGPSFGIAICGSTSGYSSTEHNNNITNNTLENFYQCAIYNVYTNGNQIVGNDISRANSSSNNCSQTLFGIVNHRTYCKSRSTRLGKNKFHDLPYSGASASAGVTDFYCFYGLYNRGNGSYPITIDSNSITKIAVYGNAQMGLFRDNNYMSVRSNSLISLQTFSNVPTHMEWEFRVGDELDFSYNSMTGSYLASQSSHFLFTDSVWASKTGKVTVFNNKVDGNKFFMDAYVLLPNEGSFDIRNNQVSNNAITGNKGGYLFAIASQLCENIDVTNNLVANNVGHDGFVGIYLQSYVSGNFTARAWQNSIYSDGAKAPVGKGYDNNGLMMETYYHQDIQIHGNIIELRNSYSGTIVGIDCFDTSYITLWDNNTYFPVNISAENWVTPLGNLSSFSDFKALGLNGAGDNVVNPKFENPGNTLFKSYQWQTQNNVPSASFNGFDITGASRNTGYCDRGAYEQYTNLSAIRTNYKVGASECSGNSVNATLTLKNEFKDTAIGFYVVSQINGTTNRQKVTKALRAGDTMVIALIPSIDLNQWGTNNIKIYIDAHDDKPKDDSFSFKTTVKQSPGGGKITPTADPTQANYLTGSKPDVTIAGEPVYYTVSSPRQYSNSAYGTQWNASAYAVTFPGNKSVSGVTYTIPSGSNDQKIKFITQDRSLEDSTIKVCLNVHDLVNGCDTLYCRKVFINPSVDLAFTSPTLICGDDTAFFKSQSSIKHGGMRYHWDFGTGNTSDTSDQPDPIFNYNSTGNYKVKLTIYTIPYGFVSNDSVTVKVSSKPKAAFSRNNACEKESITFTNQSVPSGITYNWGFGDNTYSSQKDPKHTYSKAGQYNVKLLVETGGCKDSATQKAYMFNTPVADFTAPVGQCSNTPIGFTNKTVSLNSSFASYWDFGGGNKSTQFEPIYTFGTSGSPTVHLLVVSSFGCRDSITKTLSLKEAPLVLFDHSEACSFDSTVFTNQSVIAPSTTPIYYWSFGDGSKSTAQSPWHKWSSLGNKSVKLNLVQSNGCADSIVKILNVKVQPKVSFVDNSPVCYGTEVIFNNTTTWAQGDITYQWALGDGVSSTISDPSHAYTTNTTTQYNVTLCAMLDSACNTCFTKPVKVNEIPQTCDFDAQPDYQFGFYGIQCNPKNSGGTVGPQSGVTYRWNFENSGFINGNMGQYNFQSDGKYNVTMCAEIGSSSCSCCVTKQVVMQRQSTLHENKNPFTVYPNPSQGMFQIQFPTSETWTIELYTASGSFIGSNRLEGAAGLYNATNLAAGIYFLRAKGGPYSLGQVVEIKE